MCSSKRYILLLILVLAQILSMQAQNFLPVKIDKKWGFIDSVGNLIVEARYSHVGEFFENTCNVCEGYNCGLLHKNGQLIVPIKFESVTPLSDSLFIVKSADQKYGIYKNELEEIVYFTSIIPVYKSKDELLLNDEGLKYSLLYRNDELIEIPKCSFLSKFSDFYFFLGEDGNVLIDKNGKRIGDFTFDEISSPLLDVFILKKNNTYALYNQKNKLLDFKYSNIELAEESDATLKVEIQSLMGIYDLKTQKFRFPPNYLNIEVQSVQNTTAYLLTEKNAKVNVLNSKLDTIAKDISTNFKWLSAGLIAYENQDKWQVSSNKYGLLKQSFDDISLENDGFFLVTKGDSVGLINRYGKLVLAPIYKEFMRSGILLRAVKKNGGADIFEIDSQLNLNSKNSFKKFTTLNIGGDVQVEADYSRFSFAKDENGGLTQLNRQGTKATLFRYSTIKKLNLLALYDNKTKRAITDFLFAAVRTAELNNGYESARVMFQSGRMGIVQKNGNIIANSEFKLNPKTEKVTIKPFCFISDFDSSGIAKFSINMTMNRDPSINDYLFIEQNYEKIAKGGVWGLINEKGELLVQPYFLKIQKFTKEYIIAQNTEENFGVLSLRGDTILPFEFSKIEEKIVDGTIYYTVQKKHEYWELFDVDGNAISKAEFSHLGQANQGVLTVRKNGKWTGITQEGVFISDPIFQQAGVFEDGLLPVKLNQRWGAINQQGDTIIDFSFDVLGNYSKGVLAAKQKSRYGLLDINQNWVLKPSLKKIEENDNGLMIAKKNKFYGLLNEKGKWVIKPRHARIYPLNSRYYKARGIIGKGYKLYDSTGKMVDNKKYQSIRLIHENGWFCVKKDKKYAMLSGEGKLFVDFGRYFEFKILGDTLLKARKGSKWYVINPSGKEMFNGIGFADLGSFSNGNVSIYDKKRKMWDLIRLNGDTIISSTETIYQNTGLSAVKSNVLKFVDANGRTIISKVDAGFEGNNGNTIILYNYTITEKKYPTSILGYKYQKNYSLINKFGMQLSDYIFSDLKIFEDQFTGLKTRYYLGIYDSSFRLLVEPKYENVEYLNSNVLKVSRSGQLAYFNLNSLDWIWNTLD